MTACVLPKWDTPARVCHALSFDIEEYFHSQNFAAAVDPKDWPALPSRVEPYTHAILDLLASTGRRATFFVLGWVAEHHPQLVRAIAHAGHEVASHGYAHRLVYGQTAEEFRADVRRARRLLEDLIGSSVIGYRAPTYSIVQGSLWALDVLADEGYRYDSSIFPIRHDRYGIHAAPRQPFRLANGLIEFPLSTWEVLGVRMPVAGGGYFRVLPYAISRAAFRSLLREGRPAIFYLHSWDLDADQPAKDLPFLLRVRQTIGAGAARHKLARLLQEIPFAPAAAVLHDVSLGESSLCGWP